MKSGPRGKNALVAEVTNISGNGFWLLIGSVELFVSFKDFPWFREAAVAQILNVEMPSEQHLYWPDLDVDLAVDSIRHPDRYPLVSKVEAGKTRQQSTGAGQVSDRPRTPRRTGRR